MALITLLDLPHELLHEITKFTPRADFKSLLQTNMLFYKLVNECTTTIRSHSDYLMAIKNNDILAVHRFRGRRWNKEGMIHAFKYDHIEIFDMLVARDNMPFQSISKLKDETWEMLLHRSTFIKRCTEIACEHGTWKSLTKYLPMDCWSFEMILAGLTGAIASSDISLIKLLLSHANSDVMQISTLTSILAHVIAATADFDIARIMHPYITIIRPSDIFYGNIKAGRWECCKDYLRIVAPSARDDYIRGGVVMAIKYDQLLTLQYLLESGAIINWNSIFQRSYPSNEIFLYLLNERSDIIYDINKIIVLEEYLPFEIMRLLIEKSSVIIYNETLHRLTYCGQRFCDTKLIAYTETLLLMRIDY